MKQLLPISLPGAFLAAVLATLAPGAATAQDEVRRCDSLPPAVAEKRAAILAAAQGDSLEALAALGDAGNFTASYGGGEPLEIWTALAAEGTDIREVVKTLLSLDCTYGPGGDAIYYTWPAANDLDYAALTEAEREALAGLYGGDLESVYVEGTEVGYYVGWALTMTEQGDWMALVAGD